MTNSEVALQARGNRWERPLTRRRMATTLSPAERAHVFPSPRGEGGRGTRSGEGSLPARGDQEILVGKKRAAQFRLGDRPRYRGVYGHRRDADCELGRPRHTFLLPLGFPSRHPAFSTHVDIISRCVFPPREFASCERGPRRRKRRHGTCFVIVDWVRNFAGNSLLKTVSWTFTASNIGWRLNSMAAFTLTSTRCAKMPRKKIISAPSAFDCCASPMRWCWSTPTSSCGTLWTQLG